MTYTQPLILLFLSMISVGLVRLRKRNGIWLPALGVLGLFLLTLPAADWLTRDADPESALRRITAFRWGAVEDSPYVRRCDASPFATARGIRGLSGFITFQREWSMIADACAARR